MRHRKKGRKLNRTASHRRATLRSLSSSLIKYKRIKTTLAKAKETRAFIEPLITKARKGDLHNQRIVMNKLKNKEAVKELFTEVIPAVGERPGGYTRVVRMGRRPGDSAELAIIEFVDYNEVANERAVQLKEERAEKQQQREKEEAEAMEQAQKMEQGNQ